MWIIESAGHSVQVEWQAEFYGFARMLSTQETAKNIISREKYCNVSTLRVKPSKGNLLRHKFTP